MSQEITVASLRRWLLVYADRIVEQERYLGELDAAIGDADHGANMRRGMLKVRERLEDPEATYPDVTALFRTVAMTLISSVGGAAGPLYGAFFLSAARDASDDVTISLAQLAAMFRHGLEGVQQRGKAVMEEKTMIDALQPAVEALAAAAAQGVSLDQALTLAEAAAASGMEHTIGLQAQKGRASYLGARSIGHQDPGATSTFYLLQAAAKTLGGEMANRGDTEGAEDTESTK
jgi:phosphoenolpyruvate---glycerone phosphotransferase subunit DhaL